MKEITILIFFVVCALVVYYANIGSKIAQAWKYKDRTVFNSRSDFWLSLIPFYRVWLAIRWIHDSHEE